MKRFYQLPLSISTMLLAALIISILLLMQQYVSYLMNGYSYDFSWFALSSKFILTYILWVGLSPFVYRLSLLLLRPGNLLMRILPVFFMSVVLASLHRILLITFYGLSYFLKRGIVGNLLTEQNYISLLEGVFSSFIECWIFIGFLMALNYYNYSLQINEQLKTAELNALKEQLRPHFLFNTLHAISSLMDYNKVGAQRMIIRLGDLLRSILQGGEVNIVTLEKELQYIKNYLEIEEYRFTDRLAVTYSMEEKLNKVRVPSFILQPIVENAIKHGISKRKAPGSIDLVCTEIEQNGNSYIRLEVINDNPEQKSGTKKGFGIGLQNIRKRMHHLYENNFELDISQKQHKTHVVLSFPLEI